MTDLTESDALRAWEAMDVIRQCRKGDACLAKGQIREFPNKLNCVLDWTITDRCNYNCLHCFHAADNTTQKNEFTREEAFRLLEEAEACGVTSVELTGGEPTIYPYFRDVVQEIHDRGMQLGCVVTRVCFQKHKSKKKLKKYAVSLLKPKGKQVVDVEYNL